MNRTKYLIPKEIQEYELDLLRAFSEYCNKYDLRYTLCGGTLLGAIRHKGFIPWDDDIDVMMPRPDYERFLAQQIVCPEFEVCSLELNTSVQPFSKIVNKHIQINNEYLDDLSIDYLWMDVFPMDGYSADDAKNQKDWKYLRILRFLFKYSVAKLGAGTTGFRKYAKIPVILFAKAIGARRISNWIAEFCKKSKYEDSEYVGGKCWGYGPCERMLKSEWEKRVKVEFEGHEFWAPGCWHEHLTNLYGDYMQLPPVEKRITHNMKAWIVQDEKEE